MIENPIETLVTHMIAEMGDDPEREGLRRTPERFRRAWEFMCSGYTVNPASVITTFPSEGADEMVFQGGIPFYSTCEHHLLPFFGVAHIGYIPNGRIVGLSKLPRMVDLFARRLQVQEILSSQVADTLMELLSPIGVGVVLQCRHLCMETRGVQKAGTITVTSALRGAIKDHAGARTEFLSMVSTASQGFKSL